MVPRASIVSRLFTGLITGLALWPLLTFVGCDIPNRAPIVPPEVARAREIAANRPIEPEKEPDRIQRNFAGDWQAWYAYYIKNRHVGYAHRTVKAEGEAPTQRIKLNLEELMILNPRGISRLVQRTSEQSSELVNGNLISFETQLSVGPVMTRTTGMSEDIRFSLTKTRANYQVSKKIDWNPDVRGLMAIASSLRRDPMTSGETRVFEMILPTEQKIGTVRMKCNGPAAVPMLDGKDHRLIEVNVQIDRDEDDKRVLVVWTDEQGMVQRTYDSSRDLVIYQTDMRTATRGMPEAEEIAGLASTEVRGDLENPAETQRVGFKMLRRHKATSADDILVKPQPDQFVREMNDGSLLVLVTRLDEVAKNGFVGVDLAVDKNDSRPNVMVDYNEPMVRRIAQATIGVGQLKQRELALELARSTNRLTQLNSESKMFPRASEVARDAESDSIGHAVLLAALLRAKGIPSRIAFGFRYRNLSEPQMVFHAWTLAHVDDEWLSLDATTGGIAAADRLTLSTSNLSEKNVNDALVPILDFLGTYNIEVVLSAVRYQEAR
ncbi:transglutaminase domain-containing protein [Novipirellula aureliae]|uniref:transglutaminase domain-containing protein n=1 Tax=Novipirellula aureliae TaxID=2527966 RepID=UPI0018CC92F9|nr:transglutaminase domain-containing protein [Novipirellula aureliae]